MTVNGKKSQFLHILFFLSGMGVFLALVNRFGIGNIVETSRRAGWGMVYVIILWLVIYILNTLAWKAVLGVTAARIRLSKLFALYVSGYALNTITPFLAVGGEPYRAAMLADTMDISTSVSAVVLYRVINLFSHMLLLMTGLVLGILIVPMSQPFRMGLIAILAGVGVLGYWIFTVHRDGIFVRLTRWVQRFRILGFVGRALDKHSAELTSMDALFTDAYHHRRRQFVLAVTLEYITRAMMGLEVYIILQSIGTEISLPAALFVYVTYSIIINLIFFIPMNFGIRESGLMLGLQNLTVTPILGVYVGVVIRVRELFWILIGLLLMFVSALKKIIVTKEVLFHESTTSGNSIV